MSTREFVKHASTDLAVAGFLAAGAARLSAAPLGLPIGSQTYPHRIVAAEYFTKYPGRFISMHAGRGSERHPAPTAARRGVKTFQAAKIGGVRNYFVEQNMDLTKESVAFLKTLKV
jgi:hypothetical protein